MEYIQSGSRSISLLYRLNSDKLLYLATIGFALCFGGFVGSL
ncbi:hypothetical protein SAMN04488011_101789 [Palleronia pelagia]|uniref:Uncharacterized protein n=1 Tax=Palleronia pelagia TaxID=387096 RepID=A0A1H8BZ19_9RHOB|nr:hypothetical protein SAMN04488011_101789 [Palleronia pelagia]